MAKKYGPGDAKEYLHDTMDEWDTVFDPGGKQEYTEEQLIRFAELWADKVLAQTRLEILYNRDEFGNKLKQQI